MNIWISDRFWRNVRKASLPDVSRKALDTLLEELFRRKDSREEFKTFCRKNAPENGPAFNGADLKNVEHYRIDKGARLFCYRADKELIGLHAGFRNQVNDGDFILMDVLPGSRHAQEQHTAAQCAKWARSKDFDIDEYVRTVPVVEDSPDEAVDWACVPVVTKVPMPDYATYKVAVKDPNVLLNEAQYSILQNFEGSPASSVLMMGCAGSGKTQLVETLLNFLKADENSDDSKPNAYFVLSEKLRQATEERTCRIAGFIAEANKDEGLFAIAGRITDLENAFRGTNDNSLKEQLKKQLEPLKRKKDWLEKQWGLLIKSFRAKSVAPESSSGNNPTRTTTHTERLEWLFEESLREVFWNDLLVRFSKYAASLLDNPEELFRHLSDTDQNDALCRLFVRSVRCKAGGNQSLFPDDEGLGQRSQWASGRERSIVSHFLETAENGFSSDGFVSDREWLEHSFQASLISVVDQADQGYEAFRAAFSKILDAFFSSAEQSLESFQQGDLKDDFEDVACRCFLRLLKTGKRADRPLFSDQPTEDPSTSWSTICETNAWKRFLSETENDFGNPEFIAKKEWLLNSFREAVRKTFKQSMQQFAENGYFPDRLFAAKPVFHNANEFFYASHPVRDTEGAPKPFRRFDKGSYARWMKAQGYGEDNPPPVEKAEGLLEHYLTDEPPPNQPDVRPTFLDWPLFECWFDIWSKLPANIETARELNAVAAWTQIRGILKGFLGADIQIDPTRSCHWGRVSFKPGDRWYLDNNDEPDSDDLNKAWSVLLDTHKPADEPVRKFACEAFTEWTLEAAGEGDIAAAVEKARLRFPGTTDRVVPVIKRIFSAAGFGNRSSVFIDEKKTHLSETEYQRLTSDQCEIGNGEPRKKVLAVFHAYETWRTKNGLRDENDLARTMAARIADDAEFAPPFDSVFVDECQDFTEMQILALLLLGRSGGRKVLSGDRQQIVNQTYFSPRRMEAILKAVHQDNGHSVQNESKNLRTNFRSTAQIVAIANRVKDVRKEKLKSMDQVTELKEEPAPNKVGPDVRFFHPGGAIGLGDYLSAMSEDSRVAFVVADEAGRQKLMDCIVDAERKTTLEKKTYTIQECKGLERERVICFDLFGGHPNEWRFITNSTAKIENGGSFRYYFNVLYVAVTRAQKELELVESESGAFTIYGHWLSEGLERAFSQADLENVERNARKSFDNAMDVLKNWMTADDKDQELERGLEGLYEAKRYHRPMCGLEKEDIENEIEKYEGFKLYRAGKPLEAALRLASPEFDLTSALEELSQFPDLTEDQRRVVRFLAAPSFSGAEPDQIRSITQTIGRHPNGRNAIRKACLATLADISERAHGCTEFLQLRETP